MKPRRRRLSNQELLLVLAPYPVLWLLLGLLVDPAVFRFWVTGQSINSLDAMVLFATPITFSLIYLPALYFSYRLESPITLTRVFIYATTAIVIGYALAPVP